MTKKFPIDRHTSASGYFKQYAHTLAEAAAGVEPASLDRAADWLQGVIEAGGTIYVCGNGGSAAIANHLSCDFGKGATQGTKLRPRIVSLSAEMSTFSAIANDIGYSEVFAFQLERLLQPNDLVLVISSSGNSPNILRALETAQALNVRSILFAGFEGGKGAALADQVVHFGIKNYGIVEDLHQMTMHVLAQFLRMRGLLRPEEVSELTF